MGHKSLSWCFRCKTHRLRLNSLNSFWHRNASGTFSWLKASPYWLLNFMIPHNRFNGLPFSKKNKSRFSWFVFKPKQFDSNQQLISKSALPWLWHVSVELGSPLKTKQVNYASPKIRWLRSTCRTALSSLSSCAHILRLNIVKTNHIQHLEM